MRASCVDDDHWMVTELGARYSVVRRNGVWSIRNERMRRVDPTKALGRELIACVERALDHQPS